MNLAPNKYMLMLQAKERNPDLRCIRVPRKTPATNANLLIQPAITHHQRLASRMLVQRMYAWRGYLTDFTDRQPDDPNRIALTAWQDTQPVATLALGRDSRSGLLAETLYPKEVSNLRHRNRVICEFSQLAVAPEQSSRQLLSSLFGTAHEYARALFGATDVVIEVNPRHANFYVREFGFLQIGSLRRCPRVDAPAVLLHGKLTACLPRPPSEFTPGHDSLFQASSPR